MDVCRKSVKEKALALMSIFFRRPETHRVELGECYSQTYVPRSDGSLYGDCGPLLLSLLFDLIDVRPVFPPLPASGDDDLRRFKFFPFEPSGETTPQGLDLSRQLIQLFTPKLLQDLKLKKEIVILNYRSDNSFTVHNNHSFCLGRNSR